jgi:hypothetical protein
MLKKKVILSYDYELFFGDKSGTVLKSLIAPTSQLLDAMDAVGFKGNFFVDWQMLKYLKEENTERTLADYNLITDQLKDIIRRGHRIELHIHPHWVDAKYNGDGTWDFTEFRHYSLNSFTETVVVSMFEEGANLLTDIAREVEPGYKLCAFRAGGWAVQPFSAVKKGLQKVGITIDSSIMPGVKLECENSNCDFLAAPVKRCGYYRFEDDVNVEVSDGSFIEVPISLAETGFLYKVANKLNALMGIQYTCNTDGTHFRLNEVPSKWTRPENTSICTFSNRVPLAPMVFALQAKTDLVCFIDHPKDVSSWTPRGLKNLSRVAKSILYKELIKQNQ